MSVQSFREVELKLDNEYVVERPLKMLCDLEIASEAEESKSTTVLLFVNNTTIMGKMFEINFSFHVKQHTTRIFIFQQLFGNVDKVFILGVSLSAKL